LESVPKRAAGAVKLAGAVNKPVEKREPAVATAVRLKIVSLRHEAFELGHLITNDVEVKVSLVGETTMACTGAVEPTEITRPSLEDTVTLRGKNPSISAEVKLTLVVNPAVTVPLASPVGIRVAACVDRRAMVALAAVETSAGVARVAAAVGVTIMDAFMFTGEAMSLIQNVPAMTTLKEKVWPDWTMPEELKAAVGLDDAFVALASCNDEGTSNVALLGPF